MRRTLAMAAGCACRGRPAVRFCKELFPAQLPVGLVDVAPQLLALGIGHLPRPLGTPAALAVGVAPVLAHALAILFAHLALPVLLLATLLRPRAAAGE